MRQPILSLFLFILLAGCGSGGKAGGTVANDAGPGDGGSGSVTNTGDDGAEGGAEGGGDDGGTAPVEAGPFVPGAPITATPSQWTWVPFANSACGTGSATGIGVNLSSTGTSVLIYMEGGGACWSEESCYALKTATNFTGYGQAQFTAESTDPAYLAAPGGFFDRTATANPFKDYSYVYIPYCTGDIFGGNNVMQLGTNTAHFVGYTNVTAFLERIVPTFPAADRVVLSGSSAGGFGALINWEQTQDAFGSIRVDVIDDSGTFMPASVEAEGNGNVQLAITAWKLTSIVPAGCTTCASDPSTLYGYYAKKYPDHRAALLSYTQDSVLPSYYGITTAEFTTGLDDDLTSQFTPNANLGAFIDDAAGHVLFLSPTLASGGVTVQSWITSMVTDASTWATVNP
jgi:Pectinacetylesterase